ncbi:MAG: ATP-dependent zinc protease [Candidatus Binatia bacterium]|nr:ATP-dependent zinc protease [Candidatus Binatia bacterium]
MQDSKSTAYRILVSLAITVLAIALAEASSMPTKIVIGRSEKIRLLPENLVLEARVDTGATTSSIDAHDIETFKREGKTWMRFRVRDKTNNTDKVFERPRVRSVRIKNRAAEENVGKKYERRPVVRILACLDGRSKEIEVNLADRSRFAFPMLLGRSGIVDFDAVVDPSIGSDVAPNCDPASPIQPQNDS